MPQAWAVKLPMVLATPRGPGELVHLLTLVLRLHRSLAPRVVLAKRLPSRVKTRRLRFFVFATGVRGDGVSGWVMGQQAHPFLIKTRFRPLSDSPLIKH